MSLEGWDPERVIAQGAEAVLEVGSYLGRDAVLKLRRTKGYRHPDLERAIRTTRIRAEARALREARTAGVRTPAVLDVDVEAGSLVLERIEGPTVRAAYDGLDETQRVFVARELGSAMGRLHAAGMVHGDPTTSNFVIEGQPGVEGTPIAVLDMSMGGRADGIEERGVDLRLLEEAFLSTHYGHASEFELVLEGYREALGSAATEAIRRMEEIASRGRYVKRGGQWGETGSEEEGGPDVG